MRGVNSGIRHRGPRTARTSEVPPAPSRPQRALRENASATLRAAPRRVKTLLPAPRMLVLDGNSRVAPKETWSVEQGSSEPKCFPARLRNNAGRMERQRSASNGGIGRAQQCLGARKLVTLPTSRDLAQGSGEVEDNRGGCGPRAS